MNGNVGVREEKKITQKEIRVWQNEIKKGMLFAKSLYKDGGTLQRQCGISFVKKINRPASGQKFFTIP